MDNNYNPKEYLPTIDAILSVADLEKITVKKIRHALQELFSVDLQPNKKAINDVILNRYYDLVSRRSQENDSEEDRKAEIIKQDEIMAQKLQGEMSSRTPGRRKAAPKRKNSTTNNSGATKPPSKTGFNREMALSSQLQEVIGEEKCSRPRVVKLLWAYIKDRDLQNPQDKRQINCDEKLTALFKKKTVGAFEMNKILTKHIFPLDDKGSKDNEVVSDVSEEE